MWKGYKMKNTYVFDEKKNIVKVCSNPSWDKNNTAIRDFCEDYNIKLEEFDIPVIIEGFVKNCAKLFEGCTSFNQKVLLPDGVLTCREMFRWCETFNQEIILPESLGGVAGMFQYCKSFNQPIKIPHRITNCAGMFMGCESLNQPITLTENITVCVAMFKYCKAYNQEVKLPENVDECQSMFEGCENFNQPIVIGENVSIYQMLLGCDSLRLENVTIRCKRATDKTKIKKIRELYGIDKMEELGRIEEFKEKINFVVVKPKKTAKISHIHYMTNENETVDIRNHEIKKMSLLEIHQKLEEMYYKENLLALEISEDSEESMKTLSVYFGKDKFSIGIVDEWDGTVYYYDSGEGNNENVDIQGNLYPKHMISNSKDILFLIIDEFVKSAKPTKKVKWIRE